MTTFLKFFNEAQAHVSLAAAGVISPSDKTVPVAVTDPALESALDALPLADAQIDQTVTYNNLLYMADAGKWFELVEQRVFESLGILTLDVIGTIHKPTGVMLTGEDGDYPEMAPIPGFHVNVIGNVPEELMAYSVIPENPTRIFAC